MDIDMFGKSIQSINYSLVMLKQVIELLPKSTKKSEILSNLEKAERELKIAESESATNLGYEICHQHFPPIVMLSKDDKKWECPDCHNIKKSDDYVETVSKYFTP